MIDTREAFQRQNLYCGRMVSATKRAPEGETCVWNANVVIKSQGKVWFGDLNLTREGDKLKAVAKEIGEPVYVLREMDCRFDTQSLPVEQLIERAVWKSE
jgi:hypothetical protein